MLDIRRDLTKHASWGGKMQLLQGSTETSGRFSVVKLGGYYMHRLIPYLTEMLPTVVPYLQFEYGGQYFYGQEYANKLHPYVAGGTGFEVTLLPGISAEKSADDALSMTSILPDQLQPKTGFGFTVGK
ncbi:MAG: hypothetical protein AAF998_15110 [Bacteroidota bacterium]